MLWYMAERKWTMRRVFLSLLAVTLTMACGAGRAEDAVRVFAAASLTNAMQEIAARWQADGHAEPSLSFGSSSTLAKKIESGAPADLFASADAS
jgi:molybdate transport system substrate-binding protein